MTDNIQEFATKARHTPTNKKLSDSQSDESRSLTEIMHRGIRKNGKFREKLTDYSHAFARGEKFDAMKAEMIIRDQFKEHYGETMNQMRLGLKERQENLPETAQKDAFEYARMIEPLIRDGDTMPFYRAYDYVGGALAEKLNITETGAKELMTMAYREIEGRELYDFGKALEKKFIVPEREAEQQAREVKREQTQSLKRT
ncbi:hypothetical protein [Profundibacter amoris]|uniref:Uncharacterized protein n=1 Tax=Profundibacter amoris TaxID=2171755 RepID=A0A347UG52_9RHOB|nr:hypothetical protein [Profundibacter amoris]AXX97830.1 hypothetical protein BAR1_07740 [Profundibacter amoris]